MLTSVLRVRHDVIYGFSHLSFNVGRSVSDFLSLYIHGYMSTHTRPVSAYYECKCRKRISALTISRREGGGREGREVWEDIHRERVDHIEPRFGASLPSYETRHSGCRSPDLPSTSAWQLVAYPWLAAWEAPEPKEWHAFGFAFGESDSARMLLGPLDLLRFRQVGKGQSCCADESRWPPHKH
jgi:hypothetical protein